MAEKSDQEKSEEPTQTRLRKAREEGNVARSAELSSVVLMVGTLILLYVFGASVFIQADSMIVRFYGQTDLVMKESDFVLEALNQARQSGMAMLLPITAGLFLVAFAANVAQTGLGFSSKVLEAKLNRISPAQGFKRIFSTKGVFELFKGIAKIGITAIVIYYTLSPQMGQITQLMIMPIYDSLGFSGDLLLRLTASMLAALFILSVIDAAYTRYQHRKDLRMTKQEVKDEMKDSDGDPRLKGQRRALSLKFLRGQRLDHAVLKSDVVLTNPTHYSVALRYDPLENQAPIVMAMGKDNRALKIREFARAYDVPIEPNPALTRALYAVCKVGDTIPYDHFRAVSVILAHVYKEKNRDIYMNAPTSAS
jgi:flagellar biosynthetic protein FlhB